VSVETRSFVLVPEERGDRVFADYHLMHRRAAGQQDADAPRFAVPPVGSPYPRWSLPALEAAAWAREAASDRFDAFDLGLFEAFFGRSEDLSDPDVLAAVAAGAALDADRLRQALRERRYRPQVLAEHLEAVGLGIHAIPAVVLPDRPPVVGAVPYAELERAVRAAL
jgi:predicted DsbA family dithiol-disulfide isomerase